MHAHVIGHLSGGVADNGRGPGPSRGDEFAELSPRRKEAIFDGDGGKLGGHALRVGVHLRKPALVCERPREEIGHALVVLLVREDVGGAVAVVERLVIRIGEGRAHVAGALLRTAPGTQQWGGNVMQRLLVECG